MRRTARSYNPEARYNVLPRDLEYRRVDGAPLLARVYEPQGQGPFPLLIECHGGDWHTGNRLDNEPWHQHIASSGIVVAAIEFRQGPAGVYPRAEADVNYAIRWFKAHAAEFNASPEYVGASGSGSGGHLALLNAMLPRHHLHAQHDLDATHQPDATLAFVISNSGYISPASFIEDETRPELSIRAREHFAGASDLRWASPFLIGMYFRPESKPAMLLIQGAGDTSVPDVELERFVYFYSRAGGLVQLAKYPGESRNFF